MTTWSRVTRSMLHFHHSLRVSLHYFVKHKQSETAESWLILDNITNLLSMFTQLNNEVAKDVQVKRMTCSKYPLLARKLSWRCFHIHLVATLQAMSNEKYMLFDDDAIIQVTRNVGQCPTWWPPCQIQVVPSVQCRKVWLTPTTRVPCSNATKTRNPLKLPGVPQTNETISAASGPKFTILWEHVEEILLLNKFFSDCRYVP